MTENRYGSGKPHFIGECEVTNDEVNLSFADLNGLMDFTVTFKGRQGLATLDVEKQEEYVAYITEGVNTLPEYVVQLLDNAADEFIFNELMGQAFDDETDL
jgi:hypothetical protein